MAEKDSSIQNINNFVEILSQRESTNLVFNQFANLIPKNNLKMYLQYLYKQKADILLLGEASGYNGCRWSGIAFTSGYLISKSKLYAPLRNKMLFLDIKDKKELSASVVYGFFRKYTQIFKKVVIFSSFPFHPHLEAQSETNRRPNKIELQEGQLYLQQLFNIFEFKRFYPIGKVADYVFTKMIEKGIINSFEDILVMEVVQNLLKI